MKLEAVKDLCNEFYKRFSALDLSPLQLGFFDASDSVSIALKKKNVTEDIEASVTINHDTVRLLKINTFEKIDTFFTFITPLELYTNLLTLLLVCCHASNVMVSSTEAIVTTLGQRIKTWQELVIFICSLLPEEQGLIAVHENHQNALMFLRAKFHVENDVFITDGLYKSRTPFNDVLELIRAVLDSLCAVLKAHDYVIHPFSVHQR